ncbi:MAG: hypothetical protein WCJ33_09095 [Pseudomonadota bacterium]
MAITPIQGLIYGSAQQKPSLSGSISSKVVDYSSYSDSIKTASDISISDVSIVSSKFSKNSSDSALYNLSLALAQAGSEIETAQAGTQQIISILNNLQSLAQQALNSGGDTNSLASISSQFQALYSKIDGVVGNTVFGYKKVIDGTFSLPKIIKQSGSSSESHKISDLSTKSLFGGNELDVSSQENAKSAIQLLGNALGYAGNVNSQINEVGSQLNYAIATLESVQANNAAANSTLSEEDINKSDYNGITALLLGKSSNLANTQIGNLSDSLFNKLIS